MGSDALREAECPAPSLFPVSCFCPLEGPRDLAPVGSPPAPESSEDVLAADAFCRLGEMSPFLSDGHFANLIIRPESCYRSCARTRLGRDHVTHDLRLFSSHTESEGREQQGPP